MPATATTAEARIRPETFRLPKPGASDPFFGFSRSWYYGAEKRRWLKLIRIRGAGKEKGVTLIPFEQVAAFVREQMEAQNGDDTKRQFESSQGENAQSEQIPSGKSEQEA